MRAACARAKRQAPALDSAPPWTRQPGEPGKWYDRFQLFLQLGPGRSLYAAHAQALERRGAPPRATSRPRGVPRSWRLAAARDRWTMRAEAFDAAQQQEDLDEWRHRRGEFRERQWDIAKSTLDKAQQMLVFPLSKTVRREDRDGRVITEIHPSHWQMGDVPRLALAAQKLGSGAVGEDTLDAGGAIEVGFTADELAQAVRDVAEWEKRTYGTKMRIDSERLGATEAERETLSAVVRGLKGSNGDGQGQ